MDWTGKIDLNIEFALKSASDVVELAYRTRFGAMYWGELGRS